ncbi:YggT family protein [Sphingomonas sp. MG17]|uniref:YggT family protein n=1 Tax=Sphingomonas tagetis TaxID=2949092 RepID=A0A9X2KPB1_9SPHN|nr:YggT family protein [Sphingomonas tagetis]MCP3730498.1 YggT family protein [Sphingomonas tagetis]
MGTFLAITFDIVQILLNVLWWIIVVQAVLSVLIAFNVINTYNDFVSSLWRGLNTLTEPIYRPIRRILPDTGPMDFAPFVVLILLAIFDMLISRYVGPAIAASAM